MNSSIDWDALDRLAQKHKKWRVNHQELSQIYVAGEGNGPIAFIVGEAPGAQEEIRRRPFVGDSGIILRGLMGLARLHTRDWQTQEPKEYGIANCWLTNVVKFRPPRNRTPTPDEIMSIRHLLREEWIAVGKPDVVIAVGGVALHAIHGGRRSILAMSGKPFSIRSKEDQKMYIWPMLHPSYGIREPSARSGMEKDWEKLYIWLTEMGYHK